MIIDALSIWLLLRLVLGYIWSETRQERMRVQGPCRIACSICGRIGRIGTSSSGLHVCHLLDKLCNQLPWSFNFHDSGLCNLLFSWNFVFVPLYCISFAWFIGIISTVTICTEAIDVAHNDRFFFISLNNSWGKFVQVSVNS